MNFIRLKLTNYRGIDYAEIDFAQNKPTVITGNNEAGKSSLSEAIQILFEQNRLQLGRYAKNITPVHNANSKTEIELEAKSGKYTFTYRREFNGKQKSSSLIVTKPRNENITGAEANKRANSILSETIDVALWKALLVLQGETILDTKQQKDLFKGKVQLSKALEVASSSGSTVNSDMYNIFEKAEKEYVKYFTKNARLRKDYKFPSDKEEALKIDIEKVQERINSIKQHENDTQRLKEELSEDIATAQEINRQLIAYETKVKEIERIRHEIEILTEDTEYQHIIHRYTERQRKINNLSEIDLEIDDLVKTKDTTDIEQLIADTQRLMESRQREFEEVAKTYKQVETELTLREEDYEYSNNKLHLEQMVERKQRVDEYEKKIQDAKNKLSNIKVTASSIKEIRKATNALIESQARAQAKLTVRVTTLNSTQISVGDNPYTLNKGEDKDFTLQHPTDLVISDLAKIRISITSQSLDDVKTAHDMVNKSCNKVGVNDLKEAEDKYKEKQEAESAIEENKKRIKDNLRDLSYQNLSQGIDSLTNKINGYTNLRSTTEPLPKNLQDSRAKRNSTRTKHQQQRDIYKAADKELQSVKNDLAELESTLQEIDDKRKERDAIQSMLETDRQTLSDIDLELAHKKANERDISLQNLENHLKDLQPEDLENNYLTKKQELESINKRIESKKGDIRDLNGRLHIMMKDDPEKHSETLEEQLDAEQRKNLAVKREIDAAKTLYETLKTTRADVQGGYTKPLKEKVEELASLLFEKTINIEISEELSIEERTMDGITVPFDSLSGGTKEQLSLILRFACAILVSKSGGAPLIIDDALGYTDSIRLKQMGKVIREASKKCQIIVLTCMPSRYSHIPNANVVPI